MKNCPHKEYRCMGCGKTDSEIQEEFIEKSFSQYSDVKLCVKQDLADHYCIISVPDKKQEVKNHEQKVKGKKSIETSEVNSTRDMEGVDDGSR